MELSIHRVTSIRVVPTKTDSGTHWTTIYIEHGRDREELELTLFHLDAEAQSNFLKQLSTTEPATND